MPNFLFIASRYRKLILFFTVSAALAALLLTLVMPKLYRSTVTALPANSALGDKSRLFNTNIEGLYSELGSVDELDRMEGTAALDTLYLAVAQSEALIAHYNSDGKESLFNAAQRLRKNTAIKRSAYGELKIDVWDESPQKAAALANALYLQLNTVHQQLRTRNYQLVLAQLRTQLAEMQNEIDSFSRRLAQFERPPFEVIQYKNENGQITDSIQQSPPPVRNSINEQQARNEQVQQYLRLINEFEVAAKAVPQPLLLVEAARAAAKPDRPKTLQWVLFAAFAGFLLSVLSAFYLESRR